MPLVPRELEIELTTGREGRRDPYHVAASSLLELENGVFRGGIVVRRAGTRRLTDDVLGGGTLTTALAVASCGGETLRWTSNGIWGLTQNQGANKWVRRGTANDARPLELTVRDIVSRATSADAHDAIRLGDLDIVAWTEAEEPSAAPARRVLLADVFDRATGILIAGPIRLAEDTGGTDFWRFQPRLLVLDQRALVLYVYGGRLVGRALDSSTPQTWGAEIELVDDVAERYGVRYPFEFSAVTTDDNTIRVAYTATETGGRVIEPIANPAANPPPAVVVQPDTTFDGAVDLVVTQDTALALARTIVAIPAAIDPVVARSAFAFAGVIDAKIVEDSSIARTVLVGPDVPARYPDVARTSYYFDGVADVKLWRAAAELVSQDTPSLMTLLTAGLINTGEVWGNLQVTITAYQKISLPEDPEEWLLTFSAQGPFGFSDTWQEIIAFGDDTTTRQFPSLGYQFVASGLLSAFTGDDWTWTLIPLQAEIRLNGGTAFHKASAVGPFYMYGPSGPLDINIHLGYSDQGLTLTFPAGQGPGYTLTETYRFDVQSGMVAYSVDAGPYGTPQRIYSGATGLPLIHVVNGITLQWNGNIPNNYSSNDIWTLTVPTGSFTYALNGGSPSAPLAILGADGQPLTHELVDPAPLGVLVTWPADVDFPIGEAWRVLVASAARLNMLTVDSSLAVTTGPTLLGTPIAEGLHAAAQGNDVLLTYRDRSSSNLEAGVHDVVHALIAGPIVLATSAQSQAAQGLYHTAMRLLGPDSWEGLFEPLSQAPMERIAFSTAGAGSVTSGPTPYARGLRLLTRHFALSGRTLIGAIYLPRYGGANADDAGVQPVALVLDANTQEVLARLLPGEAAPLTSLLLPRVLTEASRAIAVLPRRGRLTLEQGTTVVDITPALLSQITLGEVAPGELGRIEENATLHVGGALPLLYDGQAVTEDGFHVGPEGLEVSLAGSGGQLSAGSYVWQAVYERTDARGRRHQSPPSPPVQATAVASDLATVTCPLYQATRMQGVRIVVYRTQANGTIPYRLTPGVGTYLQPAPAAVAVDVVAIADAAADVDLLDNEPLYTARSELSHLAPPAYRSIHRWTDYLWIDRMESRQAFLYSLPLRAGEGAAWAAELSGAIPSEQGALVGVHDLGGALVLFAERGAFVVQGNGPDLAGGGNTLSEPTRLEGAVGLEDHRAKVTAPDGIFFWSRGRPHVLTRGLQTVEPGGGGAGLPALTITGAMTAIGRPPLELGASKDSSDEVRFFSAEGTVLVYSYAWGGWGTWTGQPTLALGQELLALRADGAKLVREDPSTTYDDVPATGSGGTPVALRWSHSWIKLAEFLGAERVRWLHLAAYFGEDATVLAELYRDLDPVAILTHAWALTAGKPLDTLRWHPGPDYQRCTAFRARWTITPTTPAATPANQAFRLHALGVELGVRATKDHRSGRRS